MALVGTDRGVGTSTASGFVHCTPTGTFGGYSLGILCIALDNAGSAGSAAISPATATDTRGRTWTRRQNPIFDNSAASAGVELSIYTAYISAPFSVALPDYVNITWATGTPKCAYTFTEFTSDLANTIPTYIDGGAGTGASASTSATVTTSALTAGDAVIGWGGAESADTFTGDSDTSLGSWSTQQHTGTGTSTTGMSVTSQYKIVTGTTGQTYNVTLTAADVIVAWIRLREAATAPTPDIVMGTF